MSHPPAPLTPVPQTGTGPHRPPPESPGFTPGDLLGLGLRHPVLVLGTCLLGTLLALLWVGTRTPVWTASTTLGLERETRPRDGAAAPLHAMVPGIETAGELALLRSRGPANVCVTAQGSEPREGPALREGDPVPRRLGLTTRVDDESLAPLASIVRRLFGRPWRSGRVSARAEVLDAGAPRTVRVSFPALGFVRLSTPEAFGRDEHVVEHAWAGTTRSTTGEPLVYRGLALELKTEGDVLEKSFLVRVAREADVAQDVQSRTWVGETEPGSGLIQLVHHDSDPFRVADVANALAANYLYLRVRNERADLEERRRETERELERVRGELADANAELVRLQEANPLSVERAESAKFLTLNLTSRTVEHADAALELRQLERAIELVGEGRLEGLSFVVERSADELTRILVKEIAVLQAQAQLQERSDAGAYRNLIQQRILQLEKGRQALALDRAGVEAALLALEERGLEGLGILGGNGLGTTAIDPVADVLTDIVTRQSARRTELLSGDYLPRHPEVEQLDRAIEEGLGRLEVVLRNRVAFLEAQEERFEVFEANAAEELLVHPEAERREIEAALERFREQVLLNLESLRETLAARVESLAEETARYRARLAELPASARLQLAPLQRVENAKERIAELLEARDAIHMMEAYVEPPAAVLDAAVVPLHRTSPRFTFQLFLAALVSLALGFLLAFSRELLGGPLRSGEELEHASGLPVLGELVSFGRAKRFEALRRIRRALEDDPGGREAAAFRGIRARLEARFEGRTLGITSMRPGEGRSVVAVGIAATHAARGAKVLLVNACGPRESNELEGPRSPVGLFQLFARERPLEELVLSSGQPGLDLLPVGASAAVLADRFAGDDVEETLAGLTEAYDLIVFDLPALAEEAETLSMARRLEGLLVVARGRGPTREEVERMLDEAGRHGVTLVGWVLNLARFGWLSSAAGRRAA